MKTTDDNYEIMRRMNGISACFVLRLHWNPADLRYTSLLMLANIRDRELNEFQVLESGSGGS